MFLKLNQRYRIKEKPLSIKILKKGNNKLKKKAQKKSVTPEKTSKKNNSGFADAKICTENAVMAAFTISDIHQNNLDIETLFHDLQEKAENAINGGIKDVEKMLLMQAHTLNNLFYNMIKKAAHSQFIDQLQVYSDAAFKAQKECRKTLGLIADLKNPRRATFIKQQNNALNQQVNNKVATDEISKNSEKNLTNELLQMEKQHGKTLDTGRTFSTIKTDSQLEAMEIGGGENS